MRSYLPADLNDSIYLEFTQAYVQSSPPLIKAIDSTENKIRDASTNMYTLIEDVFETEIQGVYTPLTPCYSTSCLPGQPGCYSPSCPNKLETLNGPILKDTKAPSTLSHDTVRNIHIVHIHKLTLFYIRHFLVHGQQQCPKRY